MIDLQRRGRSGDPDDTAANYIETRPYDIDGDEAGFWGIVPWGRSFGFEGDDLAEFVRLCVLRLLDAGAVPVRHSSQGEPMLWKEQTQYGTTKEQIADAIIAEWLQRRRRSTLGIPMVRDTRGSGD